MRDHVGYNRALWDAVAELRARRVPVASINGGYVVNGWQQYLHPELASRGSDGRILIPMVNVSSEYAPKAEYLIANRPRKDYSAERVFPYIGRLSPSGNIYILRHKQASRETKIRP